VSNQQIAPLYTGFCQVSRYFLGSEQNVHVCLSGLHDVERSGGVAEQAMAAEHR
jgi:hypothetical protein